MDDLILGMDARRKEHGFLTVSEVQELAKSNTIFDVFSVLICREAVIGKGNVLYPTIVIEKRGNGAIDIGNDNVIGSGTVIRSYEGSVRIGDGNEIGEGGCTIKAVRADVKLEDECRVSNGCHILDGTSLGRGSQILGPIKVEKCVLESGGSYKERDPRERGGVLKGFGTARGVRIGRGHVIAGKGTFDETLIEDQEKHHPDWRSGI